MLCHLPLNTMTSVETADTIYVGRGMYTNEERKISLEKKFSLFTSWTWAPRFLLSLA